MLNAKIVVSAGLVALANGHMFLATPARLTTPAATNGPLVNTGANFPCQIASGGTADGPNTDMAVGSSQPLAFQGTTVHGGGSCQISVTYDNPPTASSVFKVIKSFEGGCPAQNQTGNLSGEDATLADPYTYTFDMLDIPSGSGVLAWTWLPRTGGTTPVEFYMQCAAITISGSSDNAAANYKALPDVYIANLASVNDCESTFADSIYPNPGPQVEQFLGQFTTNTLQVCAAHGGAAGEGTYAAGSGSGSGSGSTATSAVASTPATTSKATSTPGGVFLTAPAGSSTTAVPTSVVVPTTTLATAVSSKVSSALPAAGTSTSGALTGNCDTAGMFNCLGGDSYQQCASGTWSVVMPLAAGTSCTAGQSSDMKIAAVGVKRAIRRFRS
ncbi:hypothetical protein BJ170DRAFT_294588 [Xylariales sp. AK1849]|nr:hypothetical protein BJ170DRAFT_294588 [Xylariales sp. AK1849]